MEGRARVGGCARHYAAALLAGILGVVIHNVHEIVVEVIRQAGKDKSADAALRDVLKPIQDLAPSDATAVAKTVFVYTAGTAGCGMSLGWNQGYGWPCGWVSGSAWTRQAFHCRNCELRRCRHGRRNVWT